MSDRLTAGAKKRSLAAALLVLLLPACTQSRRDAGPELTHAAGWSWETLEGGAFRLAAASAPLTPSPRLVVYLEGDGFAYVHPSQPSQDPTPTDPLALRLALAHPAGNHNLAWLGRPCQYVTSPRCERAYWTGQRYSPEILDSVNAAVDQLKTLKQAKDVVLVGYSGGGAVAMLLAARRTDVESVVTVAADLDLAFWTKRSGLTPLTGSLDPADHAASFGGLRQVHFTGGQDKIVGTDVVRSFMERLPPATPARLVELPDYTHTCCWARDWHTLITGAEP